MLSRRIGPCPLHGGTIDAACPWCALADGAAILDEIRARVLVHLRAAAPDPLIVGLLVRRRIGDALLVEVAARLHGQQLEARRFLVQPHASFGLD